MIKKYFADFRCRYTSTSEAVHYENPIVVTTTKVIVDVPILETHRIEETIETRMGASFAHN